MSSSIANVAISAVLSALPAEPTVPLPPGIALGSQQAAEFELVAQLLIGLASGGLTEESIAQGLLSLIQKLAPSITIGVISGLTSLVNAVEQEAVVIEKKVEATCCSFFGSKSKPSSRQSSPGLTQTQANQQPSSAPGSPAIVLSGGAINTIVANQVK